MRRDPYLDYEQDIQRALAKAEELARDAQYDAGARRALADVLSSARQDMADVRETVRAVEDGGAARFGLAPNELERRRMFVEHSENKLRDLSAKASGPAGTSLAADPAPTSLAWEQQQQEMLLAHQDQALDTIGSSLSTLRSQALLIGHEADEHVDMLRGLDADVEATQTRLQRAMTRMDHFVARTDARLGGWCVWILVAVCMHCTRSFLQVLLLLLLLVLIM